MKTYLDFFEITNESFHGDCAQIIRNVIDSLRKRTKEGKVFDRFDRDPGHPSWGVVELKGKGTIKYRQGYKINGRTAGNTKYVYIRIKGHTIIVAPDRISYTPPRGVANWFSDNKFHAQLVLILDKAYKTESKGSVPSTTPLSSPPSRVSSTRPTSPPIDERPSLPPHDTVVF